MEIMILKEVDRISVETKSVILAVIDSHVLVYLAIKWKLPLHFTGAEEILVYPALLVTSKSHAIGI